MNFRSLTKRYLTGIPAVLAVVFSVSHSQAQITIAFQGGEPADTWAYTGSGASAQALSEATLSPNKTTGTKSLVAGGNTGGGNCFGSGSGNGPDVARTFTFSAVNIAATNQFARTLTFNWGNRFPACVGTGWDAAEDLIFTPYYDGVAQAPITVIAGNNNAQYSIQSHTFTHTIPTCVSLFHFQVSVTTNRADELLFIDDVLLTAPMMNGAISQPPPISGPTSICVGYVGPNWYSVPNNPGTNYVWSGLPATASFTTIQGFGSINVDWGTTPAGTYSVVLAVADGCGNLGPSQQIQVQIINGSAPPAISGPTSMCNGETVTLTSSQVNDIEWSTGETTPTITVNSPGTYTLDYLSDCGISQTVSYTIALSSGPSATTTVTPVSCNGLSDGAIEVNSSSSNLQYALNGGVFQSANTFTGLIAGNYTVDVVSASGCASQTTAIVTEPNPLVVNATTSGSVCDGETVQLNGSTNVSGTAVYSWTGPNGFVSNDQNPSGLLESGNYQLNVTVNGCTGSADLDLVVSPPPVVQFTSTEVCKGNVTEFSSAGSSATAPDQVVSWQWSFGDGQTASVPNPGHTYLTAGIFAATLEITSQNGCTASLTQDVGVNALPDADFSYSPNDISAADPTVQFTNLSVAANSYLWIFDYNDETSTEFSPEYVYPQSEGSYVVKLIALANNGCVDSIQQTITVGNGLVFYIPNSFTPNGDGINDTFLPVFTSGMDEANYRFTLFNRWGEMVFESTDMTLGWDGKFENELVQAGTYIWDIRFQHRDSGASEQMSGHVVLLK